MCAFAEPELLCLRKPKRVVMVGLKLTHWTLRYEVRILIFSKLAVFRNYDMPCLKNIRYSIHFYVKTYANQGSTLRLAPWPGPFDIFC